jgi:hypothetical protein
VLPFKEHIELLRIYTMNITDVIGIIEDLASLAATLKADGTFDKLVAVEAAMKSEINTNTVLQDLIAKLKSIKM